MAGAMAATRDHPDNSPANVLALVACAVVHEVRASAWIKKGPVVCSTGGAVERIEEGDLRITRSCGVTPSIIDKRFIRRITARTLAINLVLNGVHQAVREIHDNFDYILPRIYGNAVVLYIGERERRSYSII